MAEQRVAFITGGAQGVGLGIALALAHKGIRIALIGRTQSKLDSAADAIRACGVDVLPIAANVKSADALKAAVDQCLATFGRLDILVNSAQEVPNGRLLDVTDEAFTAGFESGPLASFRLMKLVQPAMATQGGGVIINVTSSAGIRWDMAGYGAYGAVKQAIRALTRAAASEFGDDNIRVLTIAPHALSPALKGWIDARPEEAAEFFKTIPLNRIGDPERDIGRAVAAMCEPEFAYLTGATVPLDGGQANFD